MVITIGGAYGCGAKKVAKIAAEQLGYTLCGDEIITKAAEDMGIDIKAETYKFYDESEGTSSIEEIQRLSNLGNYGVAVSSLSADTVPLDRRISDSQSKIINAFADKGNCIILGRCADYYLRNRKDVVSVWTFNSTENCVECISQKHNISEREAAKLIRKTDKRREEYYEYFTSRKWSSPANYDLVLNIEKLGIDGAIEVIKGIATIKGLGQDTYPAV